MDLMDLMETGPRQRGGLMAADAGSTLGESLRSQRRAYYVRRWPCPYNSP